MSSAMPSLKHEHIYVLHTLPDDDDQVLTGPHLTMMQAKEVMSAMQDYAPGTHSEIVTGKDVELFYGALEA